MIDNEEIEGVEINIVNEESSDENPQILEDLRKEKVLRKPEKEMPVNYNIDSEEEEATKVNESEFKAMKRREMKQQKKEKAFDVTDLRNAL